jgi:hypothetical protein
MTQDRSINISGSGKFEGIASAGDHAKNVYTKKVDKSEDYLSDFNAIIEQLVQEFPNATSTQKQIVLQMKLQQKMQTDTTFRDRFVNAVKAGGTELIKVLTNNPFVSVSLETIKGWLEAEPQD